MLTAVKNQCFVCLLTWKYNMMRKMLNKTAFLANIGFMMLNNASFMIQWLVLFRLKKEIGGYSMEQVMLLWGTASCSFGLSRAVFAKAYALPALIVNGKLDSYLVMPKNVLLSVITSDTSPSAIGDVLYGLLIFCIFCFRTDRLILFLLFAVTGAVILTAFALLMGNLAFWFVRADVFGEQMIQGMTGFATYPDGIFEGAARFLLYGLFPVGMAVYQPVHVMMHFDIRGLLMVCGYAVVLSAAAAGGFYRGLRRYASGNLMEARV